MNYYFRFVLVLFFAFSVLGQEEVPKVEEPETQVNPAIEAEAAALRHDIRVINSQIGTLAGQHVVEMNKLEAERQSLEKQINEYSEKISRITAEKKRNQNIIGKLRKTISLLKPKYSNTITGSYLKMKINTIAFDYVYPFIFSIFGKMDKLCSFVTEKAVHYWSEFIKTDAYKTTVQYMTQYWTLSKDFIAKYWSIAKEYLIKYWNAFNALIFEKVGYDVLQTIQESIYYKKVVEILSQIKEMIKPSAIFKFLDTLRLSLQMTPYISMYADLIFYYFIILWVFVFSSMVLSFFF